MAEHALTTLNYPVNAKLGDTLSIAITWKVKELPTDTVSIPVDFTGCTALAQIKLNKSDPAPVAEFDVTLGNAENNIQYELSAAKVAALSVGKWFYDLQITFPDGTVRTFIDGRLKTVQDVSRRVVP